MFIDILFDGVEYLSMEHMERYAALFPDLDPSRPIPPMGAVALS